MLSPKQSKAFWRDFFTPMPESWKDLIDICKTRCNKGAGEFDSDKDPCTRCRFLKYYNRQFQKKVEEE